MFMEQAEQKYAQSVLDLANKVFLQIPGGSVLRGSKQYTDFTELFDELFMKCQKEITQEDYTNLYNLARGLGIEP